MKITKLAQWAAVVAIGLAVVVVYHPDLSKTHLLETRGFETLRIAESLATHRVFSDPFQPLPTGPSAHVAPLFPAYLAGFLLWFGQSDAAGSAIVWSSVIMLALQLMLFPFLAKRLKLGFWTGVLAAVAWISAGIPPIFFHESTLAALLVVASAFLMQPALLGELTKKSVVLTGILWGALLLVQPVCVLILAAWLPLSRCSRGQKIALAALPLLMVTPWLLRNWIVFHRPVFIRDDLGIELAVSNNDCAQATFELNDQFGCYESMHPTMSYDEALKVRIMGEVEYNRAKLKEATNWIFGHPKEFLLLSAQRFRAFWLPYRGLNPANGRIWRPMVLHVFTLLSIPGILLMRKHSPSAACILLLWALLFPLIYYVIQFMNRYRYPIFWVTFLAGSYFITEVARRVSRVWQASRDDLRPAAPASEQLRPVAPIEGTDIRSLGINPIAGLLKTWPLSSEINLAFILS